jgi:hypothetical protein
MIGEFWYLVLQILQVEDCTTTSTSNTHITRLLYNDYNILCTKYSNYKPALQQFSILQVEDCTTTSTSNTHSTRLLYNVLCAPQQCLIISILLNKILQDKEAFINNTVQYSASTIRYHYKSNTKLIIDFFKNYQFYITFIYKSILSIYFS